MKFKAFCKATVFALLTLLVFSCSDDDSPSTRADENHVLVVHSLPGTTTALGQVSRVDLSTGTISKVAELTGWPQQMVRGGDDLYIVTSTYDGKRTYLGLNKFSMSTGHVEYVADTSTRVLQRGIRTFTFHNGKLYLPQGNSESLIAVVDPATLAIEDTIHTKTGDLWDMTFSGDQLFLSFPNEVRVYDAARKQAITVLATETAGSFSLDKNDYPVVFKNGGIVVINPGNLSFSSVSLENEFYYSLNTRALVKDENALYGALLERINPSFSYVFGKIDLTTGKGTILTDDWSFLQREQKFIYYSESRKQFIVGSAEGVKQPRIQIVSPEGKLIKEILLDGVPVGAVVE